MKLLLKQEFKELYSAGFEILENDHIVGEIVLQGHFGSREVAGTGTFYEKKFHLNYAGKKSIVQK